MRQHLTTILSVLFFLFVQPFSLPADSGHSIDTVSQKIRLLQQQIRENRDDVDAKIELSKQLILIRQYDASLSLLEDLVKNNPDNTEAKYELASIIFVMDKPDRRSMSLAQECVDSDPDNRAYNELLAKIQQQLGYLKESLTTYEHLLELDPQSEDYGYQHAASLHFLGNDDLAEQEIDEFLDTYPMNGFGHALKGRIAYRKGNLDQAISSLEESLIIIPDNSLAMEELGKIYLEQNHPDKAVHHLQNAVDVNPFSIKTTMKFAEALFRNRQRSEAQTVMKRVEHLRTYTDQKRYFLYHLQEKGAVTLEEHYLLTQEYLTLSYPKKAYPHLEAIYQLNPGDERSAYILSTQLFQRKEFKRTLNVLAGIQNPEYTEKPLFSAMMAVSLFNAGQKADAVKILNQALLTHPGSNDLREAENIILKEQQLD